MRKKVLAMLLALVLAVGLLPAQAASRVIGEGAPAWAVEAYENLYAHGIGIGVTDSTPINRRDFVTWLVTLLDVTVPKAELAPYPAVERGYFADSTANGVVYRAVGYGIVEGSLGSGGKLYFNGTSNLTRQEAAKMLVSLLDFFSQKLGHTVKPSDSPAVYQDAASISAWALPYTQTVAAYGLMIGDTQGNFNPKANLSWPQAVVMLSRTIDLMDEALGIGKYAPEPEPEPEKPVDNPLGLLQMQSQANLLGISNFGRPDTAVAKPLTGWARGYHTIDNGDGTVSFLVATDPNSATITSYDQNGNPIVSTPQGITVETFAADGSLLSTKTLELELPHFGTFFDSGEHFYIAFWQYNLEKDDSREVFRVVQYDRPWNRLESVSVYGGESYTAEPFRSAVGRMAVSGDGKTVTLYAARNRYDGHQSNITIIMNVKPFSIQKLMGEEFPSNHVSHSFGQFIRYDGNTMVTVDHGDAYPRSFVLQKSGQKVNLLKIYGSTGDNVTNAIGSGFEVSDDGYLFLGCSDAQDGSRGPWNVFLTYVPKQLTPPTPPWPEGSTNTSMELLEDGYWRARWTVNGITWTRTFSAPANDTDAVLTWLTDSDATINTARLVKLDGNTFVAMWAEADGVHWLKLDGKGNRIGEEQVMSGAIMPPTDPVVIDGDICWIQNVSTDWADRGNVYLYRLKVK